MTKTAPLHGRRGEINPLPARGAHVQPQLQYCFASQGKYKGRRSDAARGGHAGARLSCRELRAARTLKWISSAVSL